MMEYLSLTLGLDEGALLPLLLLVGFSLAAAIRWRLFGLTLVIVAMAMATASYFVLGISVPGCPRFYSIPFGGCSYSDAIIAQNLVFWCALHFGVLFAMTRQRRR